MEYLPNRLTPLHSKIYYKEENYLKVRTAVFKYINSSIVKFGTSVRWYIWYVSTWIHEYVQYIYNYVTRLPLVLWFHWFHQFCICALILTQYKSLFSTCTILFIRSVTSDLRTKRNYNKLFKKGKFNNLFKYSPFYYI